eukprot:38888-Eustigmatos_ZCMA.PRE.1
MHEVDAERAAGHTCTSALRLQHQEGVEASARHETRRVQERQVRNPFRSLSCLFFFDKMPIKTP